MPDEKIDVIAYSGYRGEECPRLFIVRSKNIEIIKVLDMWIEEGLHDTSRKRFFKIAAHNNSEYKIFYDEGIKKWFLSEG